MRKHTPNDGLTLLITLLLMSVLLAISASLLNITLKQYRLSGIARDSEMAFQAAAAGMECAVYHDIINGMFDVEADTNEPPRPEAVNLPCMGEESNELADPNGETESGLAQTFRFDWENSDNPSNPELCTEISVFKFSEYGNGQMDMSAALGINPGPATQCDRSPDTSVPATVCTVVRSRGYNVPCTNLNHPRAVERELVQRY